MSRVEHLSRLLDEFVATDAVEQEHQARMVELLHAGNSAFSRGCFLPGHFTASTFIVSPDRDALLLIMHSKLHRWLQPGGHVDDDDGDILAAAQREVREEVGIDDGVWSPEIFDVDVHPIPAMPHRKSGPEPAHEHFDVRFLMQADTHEMLAGSDAASAKWVALGEITEAMTDASVMRAVRKLQEM